MRGPRTIQSILPGGDMTLLAIATLIDMAGAGVYVVTIIAYLTRDAGLPALDVGIGLTAAGLIGLTGGVAFGDLADRYGARRILVLNEILEAVATAALIFAHSLIAFLLATIAAHIASRGAASARGSLIAAIGGNDRRVWLRAYLRAVTNAGLAVGTLLGAVVLVLDTHGAYVAMIAIDAGTFLVAAALVARISAATPRRIIGPKARRWVSLADRPYLAVSAVNGVVALNITALTIGVPLWVLERTDAPRWIVAPLLMISTLMVVVLQVRAARGVHSPKSGAAAVRRAGVAFLVAWSVLALAHDRSATAAILLLTLGVAIHTLGEMWHAAGSFELSFSLADPDAHGQYQGVFGLGQGVGQALGPGLVTTLCLGLDGAGWVLLGAVVAAGAALAPAATRRAIANRPPPLRGRLAA